MTFTLPTRGWRPGYSADLRRVHIDVDGGHAALDLPRGPPPRGPAARVPTIMSRSALARAWLAQWLPPWVPIILMFKGGGRWAAVRGPSWS